MSKFGTERFKIVMLLCWVILLSACSHSSDHGGMYSYLERLSNVLELDDLDSDVLNPVHDETLHENAYQFAFKTYQTWLDIQAQSKSSLDKKGPSLKESETLNILDFLSLHGCEVQQSIARKNSSLGKFAYDSQKLIETLRFLEQVPDCIGQLNEQGKNDLAATLKRAEQQKQEDLYDLVTRATVLGLEAKSFWKPPKLLDRYPESSAIVTTNAILDLEQQVRGISRQDYRLDSTSLEGALFDISKGDGGALIYALIYYRDGLSLANKLIQARMLKGCSSLNSSQMIQRLENIVHKYFVAEVQVWAADLNRRYYDMYGAYQKLEDSLKGAETAAYKQWRLERDEALNEALEISRTHVNLIESLKDSCV